MPHFGHSFEVRQVTDAWRRIFVHSAWTSAVRATSDTAWC
jgi:hypothetical protein